MIVILQPDTNKEEPGYKKLMSHLESLPDITIRMHDEKGTEQTLTEIYLVGNTMPLDAGEIEGHEVVDRVVRVSREYRILGRHKGDDRDSHFEYNGVRFGQDNLQIFAGLCAVDNPEHVEIMMKAVQESGLQCTRMGAYKPRTNPYSFQGMEKIVFLTSLSWLENTVSKWLLWKSPMMTMLKRLPAPLSRREIRLELCCRSAPEIPRISNFLNLWVDRRSSRFC